MRINTKNLSRKRIGMSHQVMAAAILQSLKLWKNKTQKPKSFCRAVELLRRVCFKERESLGERKSLQRNCWRLEKKQREFFFVWKIQNCCLHNILISQGLEFLIFKCFSFSFCFFSVVQRKLEFILVMHVIKWHKCPCFLAGNRLMS